MNNPEIQQIISLERIIFSDLSLPKDIINTTSEENPAERTDNATPKAPYNFPIKTMKVM